MNRKTILIAETNEIIAKSIIRILQEFKDSLIVLANRPENSKELLNDIYTLKPDIVITNKKKKDYPATD